MKRIGAIARKEFYHILRDPRSLTVAILMPLVMVILYGYAIDMELKRLKVAVFDLDRSAASRDFVREMTSSGFILLESSLTNREEIESGFRRGSFRAAIVLPAGYGERLAADPTSSIQIIIDGADGTTAATVGNYINAVTARLNRRLAGEAFGMSRFPIEAETRVLFNPMLLSANFVVPGLVAIVLVMICALLTSIAIARERETGTLEQVLTTPIAPAQVIIGKVIPYFGIGAVDAGLIFVAGRFIFNVPNNGSWLALAGYTLIYLGVALALGLVISTFARTQQIAMMAALMGTLLPTLMLSGFIFPVKSMPIFLQGVSHIVPASYFLRIIRGVMLKGANWYPFEGGVLVGVWLLATVVAVKRFRVKLD